MRLKPKATLLLVLITVLGCGGFAFFSYLAQRDLLEDAKKRELSRIAVLIQNDVQEQSSKAAARASFVCNLDFVKEAMRARDREGLAKKIIPAFLIQRELYGVREGQFHYPPATSFLRVFDVSAPQEDLSKFRELVLAANRRQVPQKGIEIGRRGLSIRGIDLIVDGQGAIGSFEVGMSFSTVMENVKKTTGFEAAAFVNDKLMLATATEIPRPPADYLIGGYQAVAPTNWPVLRAMVSPDLLARVNDITYRYQHVDGTEYGLVLVPMLDFKGAQIGSMAAVGSLGALHTQFKKAVLSSLGRAALVALFLTGAILILANLLFVRPLVAVQETVTELVEGKTSAKLQTMPTPAEELRTLRSGLEKLREKVAPPSPEWTSADEKEEKELQPK